MLERCRELASGSPSEWAKWSPGLPLQDAQRDESVSVSRVSHGSLLLHLRFSGWVPFWASAVPWASLADCSGKPLLTPRYRQSTSLWTDVFLFTSAVHYSCVFWCCKFFQVWPVVPIRLWAAFLVQTRYSRLILSALALPSAWFPRMPVSFSGTWKQVSGCWVCLPRSSAPSSSPFPKMGHAAVF